MSTNHNRIRVADLETNQRNKILKTNEKGELEFSDLNNLQTENYNALDCTTEGKALDARQGKVLKDLVEQADSNNMKLSGNQTFSGVKTATNTSYPQNAGIVINNTSDNNDSKNIALSSNLGTSLFCDNTKGKGILSQTNSGYAGHFYCYGNGVALYVNSPNSANKTVLITGNTKNDNVNISNAGTGTNIKSISTGTGLVFAGSNGTDTTSTISKEGNITAKSLELSAGTVQKPALVIPNGSLTTTPQNGAIERDENGDLYTTRNEERNKIVTENNSITVLAKGSSNESDLTRNVSTNEKKILKSFQKGLFPNRMIGSLFMSFDYSGFETSGLIEPTEFYVEYFLKFSNGFFSNDTHGITNEGQYHTIMKLDLRGMPQNQSMTFSTTFRTIMNNDGSNGNRCGIQIGGSFYNTRKADNSDNENPENCQFEIVEKITWAYDDSTNINGNNTSKRAISQLNAFYIQKII